jgi:16S rRNA (guanine527-N7)-methyltransferase
VLALPKPALFHVKHPADWSSELRRAGSEFGAELDEERLRAFELYAELLLGYREANVIGAKDLDTLVSKHFVDSLSCFLVDEVRAAENVVDIGSGGGLPGIPAKIASPGIRLTLVESTAKKCEFLRYAVDKLGFRGVRVENGRAEELGRRSGFRGEFEVALVRAVAELPVLVEYGVPLLREGGVLVAMKGRLEEEELRAGERAAEILGAGVEEVLRVPEVEGVFEGLERNLVVIRKHRESPQGYPRRPGVPKKRPLGIVSGG